MVLEILKTILTFMSDIKWPITVLLISFAFRRTVKKLIIALADRLAYIKRLRGPGGVDIQFIEKIEKIEPLDKQIEMVEWEAPHTKTGKRGY